MLHFSLVTSILLLSTFISSVLGIASLNGTTRTYFVAAVERDWDYMPTGMDMMNEVPIEDSPQAAAVAGHSGQRIGHVYKKALFREYTDESFTTEAPRPTWLGMLGPIIRAEVGDTVKVVFRNMASHNHTMHPHGFRYAKSSEGLSSAMQMTDGNAVPPGQTWTYTWEAPERSGPGPLDPPSLAWTYHSDAAGTQDVFSGLVGASIIYRQGELAKHTLDVPTPSGSGLIEEVLTLFLIVDENESYYIDENTLNKTSISDRELQVNRMDPGFRQSNLKHTINGFMFGNLMGINLTVGTHPTWHVEALGTVVNVHTPHWHGNTLWWAEQQVDVINVMPAQTRSLVMTVDNPGTWVHHCQVLNHRDMGMIAMYTAS
ncbi:Hephaestin-like protein [Exophiala dermatitidis]